MISGILLLVYCCNHFNVILGSNTVFYKTIFQYPDTEWVCKEPNVELYIYNQSGPVPTESNYGIIKLNGDMRNNDFIVQARRAGIDIRILNENGSISGKNPIFSGTVKYKKNIWGDVISMTVYNIKTDELFYKKYKTITFAKNKI